MSEMTSEEVVELYRDVLNGVGDATLEDVALICSIFGYDIKSIKKKAKEEW